MLSPLSTAEVATDHRRITQLLKCLVQSRAVLTTLLPASSATHTSALIEVNSDKRLIKLDEFVPAINPVLFNTDDRLSIHSKIHGISIHFDTRFEHVGRRNDYEFFVCDLPDEVIYDQKRKNFRLMSLGSRGPSISFQIEGVCLKGTVLDISSCGAKVKLNSRFHGDMEVGDIIPASRIQFPDKSGYNTASQICSFNSDANTMGVKFLSLNDKEVRELQNWIMNTERKNLRRKVYLSAGSTAMT